jgi:general bacterial porin, GBP family
MKTSVHATPEFQKTRAFKALPLLPLLALLAAPVALAQSSVTVYGIVDLFVESARAGNGTITRVESGGRDGSRLGFTGREDLGGGHDAHFTLEMGILADTGALDQGGLTWGRQAFVGLGGPWGNLNLGRQNTPQFLTTYVLDPFLLGQSGNLWNVSGYLNFRQDNSIVYETPKFGPVSARLMYAPNENTSLLYGKYIAGSAMYADGPLMLTASVDRITGLGATPDQKYAVVGGTYALGMAKIYAAVQLLKNTVGFPQSSTNARVYNLGTRIGFGSTTVVAQVARHKERSQSGLDGTLAGVGAEYALSKRTNLYSSFSHISNGSGAVWGMGYTQIPVATGSSVRALQAGINHNF